MPIKAEKILSTEEQKRKGERYRLFLSSLESASFGLLLVLYVFLSLFLPADIFPSKRGGWATFWVLLLLGDFFPSIARAIHDRRLSRVSIWSPFLFVYLFLGMAYDLWHPYWSILLLIPVYYCFAKPIDNYRRYKEKE